MNNRVSHMIRALIYVVLLPFATSIMPGCSGHEEHPHQEQGHHSIVEQLRHADKDTIEYEVSTEELMADIKKVLAQVPESENEFYVLERQSMIKSYPCSNCHSVPLEELKAESKDKKKAHWNIELVHAGSDAMECNTCHDTNNLDQLKTITGKALTFDHSYKQCAQCHSQQYKDWIGGAHGKRVAGWAPPRLIYSCASCHNPHSPAFKPRWPARLNTQKLKELNGK